MSKIGEYIRRWRKEQKLTQKQMADLLFVNKASIQHWEKGITDPTYYCIKVIHEVTGCDWEDVF